MIVLLFLLALMFLSIGVVSYAIGPVQRGDEARRLWRVWILRYVNAAVFLATLGVIATALAKTGVLPWR